MAQSSSAHRRLLKEYRALASSPPDGISAGPVSEDDLLHWEAVIQGPEGTPFEGGVFPAELRFPRDYPLAPPTMKFLCDLWHPNGGLEGARRRGRTTRRRGTGPRLRRDAR
jgi:ubiquitin-conjugating enzyme E2 G2